MKLAVVLGFAVSIAACSSLACAAPKKAAPPHPTVPVAPPTTKAPEEPQKDYPPFVFRGHAMGDDMSSLGVVTDDYGKWNSSDATCSPMGVDLKGCQELAPMMFPPGNKSKSPLEEIAGMRVLSLYYMVRASKIYSVDMRVGKGNYETLTQMLIGKYGPPVSETTESASNKMGATFTGRVRVWKFKDGDLIFDELGDSLDESDLHFENAQANAQIKAAAVAKSQEAGKSAF
jgi:hypothetical protein